MPRYHEFSLEVKWGDPECLRRALDVCWIAVSSGEIDDDAIARDIAACEAVTPDTEDFAVRSVSYALDAAVCVAYALESLLPDATNLTAAYASQSAVEAVAMRIGREALVHRLSPEDELVYIDLHEDMLFEMDQQERAVEFLDAHPVLNAVLVREFRSRLAMTQLDELPRSEGHSKSATHRRLAWDGWISLVIPEGWQMSEEADVISLYDPRCGVGALQASLSRRSRPSPVEPGEASDLAIEFARQKGWLGTKGATPYMCDGSPASFFEFVEDGEEPTLWRVWHFMDRTRVALVTYNCALGLESVERSTCEEVVGSFRWLPAA